MDAPTAAVGPVPPDVRTAYVALCLRLRRLRPELVDVVAVDARLRRAVDAEPVPTAADLVREAGRLAEAVPDAGLAATSERFVAAGLRAVEWRARRLAGQGVPFAREIRECLDLDEPVGLGDPDAYRAVHHELSALLPGPGPLAARLAAHRRHDAVPADRLGPAVRALTAALRDRVAPDHALPATESVDCRLVADAPWRALHTYRGGFASVVRFAAGGPPGVEAGRLPRLVAHETYPGHHVECCHAERAVARGRVELGVTVLGAPWTVVSEGLAECALDTAAGPGWGRWAAPVLATAGVVTDGALAERLDALRAGLRPARLDAALMLHGAGRPGADARATAEAHLRRWLLLDDARARRVVDALLRPLWRTQVVAAVRGAALVRDHLARAGADADAVHRRLLDDPPTPGALRVRTGTASETSRDRR